MGICSYSVSYSEGLHYCLKALDEFKKLETSSPEVALVGRSKCLQLISTIYSRQGKYQDAIQLSREAMIGFLNKPDSNGYLGLIYSSLGNAYAQLGLLDSVMFYHSKALDEHLQNRNFVYLPGAYIKVADVELQNGNAALSKVYYDRAAAIADSTGNRQALVISVLGLSSWTMNAEKDFAKAELLIDKANAIASRLTDKTFKQKVLASYVNLYRLKNDFKNALLYKEQFAVLSDSLSVWEKDRIVKQLEVQFEVAEKERQLKLIQKENDITRLTNFLLWGAIACILIIGVVFILFLRRINRRDKSLLQTREELMKALEEKKILKEKQLQNELEFKESQLSALALQMMQKSELLHEVKAVLDKDKSISDSNEVQKLINKGHNQDSDWADFNTRFESINKNFYSRLKTAYPEISPNDLRICALIKLNLSIKEMAGILNISPDSVKTARYRLRKKLQLNTEDNLTEFILSL
ncbi:MAG: hypothetical protein IPP71_11500 [Bacteroidetes bacterium]|nr:hypothetical protein [Bacteroidota bacterium]